MIMYASFASYQLGSNEKWESLKFIEEDIVASKGYFNGTTFIHFVGETDVILCQCRIFPLGELYWTVKFDKPLEEIYIDSDDECEMEDCLPDINQMSYAGCDEKALKKGCMYGSFVTDIKAHEIVEIYMTYWNCDWWCKEPLMIPVYKRLKKGAEK